MEAIQLIPEAHTVQRLIATNGRVWGREGPIKGNRSGLACDRKKVCIFLYGPLYDWVYCCPVITVKCFSIGIPLRPFVSGNGWKEMLYLLKQKCSKYWKDFVML